MYENVLITLRAYHSVVTTLTALTVVMSEMNRKVENMDKNVGDIQGELATVSRNIKEMQQNMPHHLSLEAAETEMHSALVEFEAWLHRNGPTHINPAEVGKLHQIRRKISQVHEVLHDMVHGGGAQPGNAGMVSHDLTTEDLDSQNVTDATVIPQTEPVPNPLDEHAGINQENATATSEADASKA